MPLHTEYRPSSLDEILGNEHIKESLKNILESEDKPRTYLLYGPSGTGKTSLSRIIAKELGCNMEMDFQELNIAEARGIDSARAIMEDMRYFPRGGPIKVYVLDEVQSSIAGFQEALLKPLEDTPSHVVFILATTDPQKLKATIRNRCSQFELMPLPTVLIRKLLNNVLEKEGVETFPKEAINIISELSNGCPRDALQLLNQVIDIPTDEGVIAFLKEKKASEEATESLAKLLLQKADWKEVSKALKAMKEQDSEKTRNAVLGYCSKVLLDSGNKRAGMIMDIFASPMYSFNLLVLASYKVVL